MYTILRFPRSLALFRHQTTTIQRVLLSTHIAIGDPRLLFDSAEKKQVHASRVSGDPRLHIRVQLSQKGMNQLQTPQFHAAEGDEPGNTWYFGKLREVFEYDALGSIRTQSGFVCAIDEDKWQKHVIPQNIQHWDDFINKYGQTLESLQPLTQKMHPEIAPLLFVGKVVSAASATVYAAEHTESSQDNLEASISDIAIYADTSE